MKVTIREKPISQATTDGLLILVGHHVPGHSVMGGASTTNAAVASGPHNAIAKPSIAGAAAKAKVAKAAKSAKATGLKAGVKVSPVAPPRAEVSLVLPDAMPEGPWKTTFGEAVGATLANDPRCGKLGWTQILYGPPAKTGAPPRRVVLAGLGKLATLEPDQMRQAVGAAVRAADAAGIQSLSLAAPVSFEPPTWLGDGSEPSGVLAYTQAAVEGAVLAVYYFASYKTRSEGGHLTEIEVFAEEPHTAMAHEGVRRGLVCGEAQNAARHLAELPGNALYPARFAEEAAALAKGTGLTVEVYDEKKLARMGLAAVLAVGGGSANPPRMIVLKHQGGPRNKPPALLVGKGITFDSGGISLKDSTPSVSGGSIDLMRTDKTGACTVVAAMTALARLKVHTNVVGIAICAENMPSHTAYRPGDIISTHAGKTVEIMSTDAEGRLVLADALSWGKATFQPRCIVDVATLTGACQVALGEHNSGLFCNHDGLCQQVGQVARLCGEPVWRLPLQEPYREQTRSKIADLLNSGGRAGGASTAAAFLWEFVGDDIPWAHLDIAGVMHTSKDRPYLPKGAVAISTRTLIALVIAQAQQGH